MLAKEAGIFASCYICRGKKKKKTKQPYKKLILETTQLDTQQLF